MPHSTYMPEKMGSAAVSPTGAFEAGSFQEFTVIYTAGYFGINPVDETLHLIDTQPAINLGEKRD